MFVRDWLICSLATKIATALPNPQSTRERFADFGFGQEPVRGLNIGGWLVLEPWITPSIFEGFDQSLGIIDEFTLAQKIPAAQAQQILKTHWDTWCNFSDFQKIANAGFNTVRIPIGYWAYALESGETYTQGAAPYLDAAVDWARATGLKIWIDLHGAPGSQNGFDNSGHKVSPPGWQQGNTVSETLQVLSIISAKYAQPQYQDVIVAIELLNEPLSPVLNFDMLKQFYRDGFDQVRQTSDTPVVLHDGFVSPSTWNGFLTPSDGNAQNVIVDHHEYQVFDDYLVGIPNSQHRQLVCNNSQTYRNADKWTIIGEWSAAETDCATYLNGYLVGARYDGTYPGSSYHGSCSGKNNITNWDATLRDDVRGYIEAQLETYEAVTQGWIFWNFKTERSHEWDAFALLDAGLFPQPLTDRKFGPACSNYR